MAEEPMRPRCRDLAVHTVKLAWYANFTSWGLVVRRTHSCLARTWYMRGMRRGARAVCAAVHARLRTCPHMRRGGVGIATGACVSQCVVVSDRVKVLGSVASAMNMCRRAGPREGCVVPGGAISADGSG